MRVILGRILWNVDIMSVDGAPLWDPAGEMHNMKAFMTWQKPELLCKAAVRVRDVETEKAS